jgi:hypothetical protein
MQLREMAGMENEDAMAAGHLQPGRQREPWLEDSKSWGVSETKQAYYKSRPEEGGVEKAFDWVGRQISGLLIRGIDAKRFTGSSDGRLLWRVHFSKRVVWGSKRANETRVQRRWIS